MLKMCTLVLLTISICFSEVSAAILWDSGGADPRQESRFDYDRTEEAREVSSFWATHKMGVGLAAGGTYGIGGGVVGVYFHPQWSVDLGFGGGSHFQAYGVRVKKMLLLSSALNPYVGLGFHRWVRTTTRPINSDSISPSLVVDEFLSDRQREEGSINEKLISGTLGLQYTFTHGAWEGYGLFLEALFMVSTEDFDTAPTGSLGFNYFF